jgi:hypothetical protein
MMDNLEREKLLQYNTRKQNNRVPLVITYSKALPNIHDILRKNMKILNPYAFTIYIYLNHKHMSAIVLECCGFQQVFT